MCYNFVLTVLTQRNFVADFKWSAILCGKRPFCVFEYDVHSHWKARSGLPISVKWTFFARCYCRGATRE